jgi:hypothetical protein
MGGLAAVSASISSARLDSATNALGQFDELYVIAAAVIGGTSLAGGLGTIYGAMLGALVMQSLQSGMTLLNFESAVKDMVVGSVLVFAVFVDQVYRKREVREAAMAKATKAPAKSVCRSRNAPCRHARSLTAFGGIKAVDHASVDLFPVK